MGSEQVFEVGCRVGGGTGTLKNLDQLFDQRIR